MANIKELLANMIGKINGKLNAPEQAAQPNQQLVTDADGVAKWEDKPYYTTAPEGFIPTTVPVIQSAQVGQTIIVKSVDENGKPTEWEAADISGVETVNGIVPDENGNVLVNADNIDFSMYDNNGMPFVPSRVMLKTPKNETGNYGAAFMNLGTTSADLYKMGGITSSGQFQYVFRLYGTSLTNAYLQLGNSKLSQGQLTLGDASSTARKLNIISDTSERTEVICKFTGIAAGASKSSVILRGISTPVNDEDGVNKAYVDAKVSDTALILASSTEGSTKLFKVTVDDSGTITATEVT